MSFFEVVQFILVLLGSLCIFIFGIKLLSDSLQKIASNKMRAILYKMTSNKFKGVLTGFLITTVVQSSSATTVMIVSFVNAGLLSLTGAISIIMGANIGTTVTAWIVSILGFKVSMSVVSLPIIGLALPLLFSKKEKNTFIAETLIGFGLIFIGLQFLTDTIPNIEQNPEMFAFLGNFANANYWSVLFFVLVGTILTIILQSSSATMALTLVLCFNGVIPFHCAAAMVLGENIGTTITANIAALIANKQAKRAALGHVFFNIFGAIWMLIVFFPFLNLIDKVMISITGSSIIGADLTSAVTRANLPIALSIFHTSFNVINTFILIWFVDWIAKIVTKIIKDKDTDDEFRLKFISQGIISTTEFATIQAKKEIEFMAQQIYKMIKIMPQMITTPNEKELNVYFEKMDKYEEISDRMQEEIAKYLVKTNHYGDVSKAVSKRIFAMLKIIDDLERIGDRCYQFTRTYKYKVEKKMEFSAKMIEDLLEMISTINEAYKNLLHNLSSDYHLINLEKGNELEEIVNNTRDKLQNNVAEAIQNDNDINFAVCNTYSELFTTCERIGDIIQNVNNSISTCS
ncbi:MAG: Na/Pi cotransporter family protein [Bacteroidales bacterium]|jgi:phosphate:Na+ symporter